MPAPMPPFFGSPNRMSVIIALAKHGACTTEELRVLLGHQTKRSLFRSLGELEELGIVTSYPSQRTVAEPPEAAGKSSLARLSMCGNWTGDIRGSGRYGLLADA